MNNIKEYLSDILELLGPQRSKLPVLVTIFFLVSMLDLVGIGLVGTYVSFVTETESLDRNRLPAWVALINLDRINLSPTVLFGIFLVALFVIKTVVAILINRYIFRFSANQVVYLRGRAMATFQNLPYLEFVNRNSAEYIQSIQAYVTQYSSTLTTLLRLLSEGIVFVAIIVMLGLINWVLVVLLAALSCTLFIGFDRIFRKRVYRSGKQANLGNQLAIRGIQEGISGLKEIRILGKEWYFLNQVVSGSRQAAYAQAFNHLVEAIPKYLVEVIIISFVVLLVGVMFLQADGIDRAYPVIGMFGIAILRIGPAVSFFSSSAARLRGQRHGISELVSDLRKTSNTPHSVSPAETLSQRSDFSSIKLQNVCFSYPSKTIPAIDNLSLEFVAGQSIGLIGESGSGKSTLVDVLMGLLVPTSGKILYNGEALKNRLTDWRSITAYLPQDVFLIDDTLRHNVALGIEEGKIDDSLLIEALQQTRLSELVSELPSGVDTMLGERGVRLSGGQRQRVALARAFYHRREVLVLDEATSALDHETEREIVNEIQELKGEKTMIVIAHRLSTLQHCDRVYRMKKGKIIQAGTYDQVIHGPKIERKL
jgi:ATP-binding cassette, subfamily B, bacterial PglK